jgi:hypothetical protein
MKNYEFGLPITSSKFSFIFVNLLCFGDRISVRNVKILSAWNAFCYNCHHIEKQNGNQIVTKKKRRKHMSQQCCCPHIKCWMAWQNDNPYLILKTKHQYCSLGSVFTLTKQIIIFSHKKEFIFKFWKIIYFSIVYYNIVIRVVKLFRV